MNQHSAFDRQHIEESSVIKPPGVLDQLNLPPAVISFLRKNQRTIWIVAGCIAFIVVAVTSYNHYREYREEKAAIALTDALQQEGDKKPELLAQVVDEYGSTSSGLWARVELAHLEVEKGELDNAIKQFNEVKNDVSAKNPATPLILYALGALYENKGELDKAVDSYTQLSAFKGFEASSYEAAGRIYEEKGQKAKALEMYKKALGSDTEPGSLKPGDPARETIQARINYLQD